MPDRFDSNRALVRIAGERSGNSAGSGFIFYFGEQSSLILTSGSVITNALGVQERSSGSGRVWIDGTCEARSLFTTLSDGESRLVVLTSEDPELRNRIALRPLGQGPPKGKAWIISYQKSLLGSGDEPSQSDYAQLASTATAVTLANSGYSRIGQKHFGSPVLDDRGIAVAVVTGVERAGTRHSNELDGHIVAGLVDQLDQWAERPPDLYEEMPEIFISYSQDDEVLVEQIEYALERNRYRVWRDNKRMTAGSDWVWVLNEVLGSVGLVLYFCSVSSMKSEFVKKELSTLFCRLKEHRPPFIIPVLLPGGELPAIMRSDLAITLTDNDVSGCVDQIIRAIEAHRRACFGRTPD